MRWESSATPESVLSSFPSSQLSLRKSKKVKKMSEKKSGRYVRIRPSGPSPSGPSGPSLVPVAEVPRADATYMANLTVLLEFESIWNLKYVVCKCECLVVDVF